METRKGDTIDESAIGGNASQEEQSEELEGPGVKTGIDLVLNHRLEDISQFFTDKKALQSYLKKYVKNLATKLDEDDKEKCKKFKASCGTKLANFLKRWDKDASVYIGEQSDYFADEKATPMIGCWNEDGMSLTFYMLADGILEEKQ